MKQLFVKSGTTINGGSGGAFVQIGTKEGDIQIQASDYQEYANYEGEYTQNSIDTKPKADT